MKQRRTFLPKGLKYDRKTQTGESRLVIPVGGKRVDRMRIHRPLPGDLLPGQDPLDYVKDEHEKFRKELEAELRPGRPKSLRGYFESRWKALKGPLAEGTALSRYAVFEYRILPYLGDLRLEAIDDVVINGWKRTLREKGMCAVEGQEKGYSPYSINDAYSALRWLLYDAVGQDAIQRYPIRDKKKIKKEEEDELNNEMNDEEYAAYLGAFDNETAFRSWVSRKRKPCGTVATFENRLGTTVTKPQGGGRCGDSEATGVFFSHFRAMKPFFIVALETGLDRIDLINLTWDSVNMKTGWIRVKRIKTRVLSRIPISGLLEATLKQCRENARFADRVLCNYEQQAVSEITVRKYHEAAKGVAGITRHLRFKDLRHTFACRLASRDASISDVQMALGHKSPRMTLRYFRASEESSRARILAARAKDTCGTSCGTRAVVGSGVGPENAAKSAQVNQ